MKKAIVITASVLCIVLVTAIAYIASQCPCERTPGFALWGEEVSETVSDWSFANQEPLCQLQVSRGWLPHAINLNCMSGGGELFISCSRCDGKHWSSIALSHPEARIQIGNRVYPVRLSRVTVSERLDQAWLVRAEKLKNFGRTPADTRPDHWWSFQLTSR